MMSPFDFLPHSGQGLVVPFKRPEANQSWLEARSPMIDSVMLRNFRAFREVALTDCRRVNIIVGENGSGKTALLEGMFLGTGGSPEISLRIRQWRGFNSNYQFQALRTEVDDMIWGEFFYANDMSKSAVIELKGRNRYSRTLTMSSRPVVRLQPINTEKPVYKDGYQPIIFRYKTPDGSYQVSPDYTKDGIQFPPTADSNIQSSFYPSNHPINIGDVASRFSALSKTFKIDKFKEVFREHFPRVLDLSIESSAGLAYIFAEVEGLPQKIPLNNVSSGMSKLAALLLTMHAQPNGVLLIDEIENGFYYEKFPLVWEALYDFACEYNSQIFVSSHSGECLLAAAAIAESHPEDFCLFRATSKNGETKFRRSSGESFAKAMDRSIEIR